MDFKDTELTLGLPGGSDGRSSGAVVLLGGSFKSSMKRGFMETVDLEVENSNSEPRGQVVDAEKLEAKYSSSSSTSSSAVKPPAAKTRVVGWPPVRLWRKKVLEGCKSKYVKVGADGAPYLRKVDLEMYNSYEELLSALEQMFTNTSFTVTIVKHMEDRSKLMKPAVKGMEYAATYEDKDGDWMLVGDVPWKLFTESCKRIRLMKSSEAVGIAPRSTFSQCTSTN